MTESPLSRRGSPDDRFAHWELVLTGQVVHDFLATRQPFGALAFEDLVQECLAHWWLQRPRYSEERGASRPTFLRRVIKPRLLDLERREKAAKRGGYSQPLSLDAPAVPGGTEDTTSLGALLPDDDPERTPDQLVDRLVLRSLIERAVSRLSPRQRRIVQERGSGTTMAELSRLLAVPRPTLYDELERIKAVFRDEGLEEFLR